MTAVHVSIGFEEGSEVSVSTQIGVLRKLLLGGEKVVDEGGWWKRVREGEMPLVVRSDKADVIARLIKLKGQFSFKSGSF